MALSDLRFYVSDIVVIDPAGRAHAVSLSNDTQWQQGDLALIDLEDGSGSCVNGSAQTNAAINGTSSAAEISSIEFTLGVPFELNHTNPLTAQAPLDQSAMHWHWRSGYKFLRAGIVTESDGYWIHLGSTGCEGEVRNITGCSAANRVSVELQNFNPQTDDIALDLAILFAAIDLTDGTASDCSSSPAENTCAEPFAALGLGFANKAPGTQSAFRALQ